MSEQIAVIGLDEVTQLLREMPKHTFGIAKSALNNAALNAHKTVSDGFKTGDGLKSRTGQLRRSLKTKDSGNTLSTLRVNFYTNKKYAPIQEHGETITAKYKYTGVPGGPYLNIPLDANKTPAGVMRMNAREVFSGGGFIVKSKIGNYLVMSGAGIPMFVLKKQVTIPARLGMQDAANDEVPTILSTLKSELLKDL